MFKRCQGQKNLTRKNTERYATRIVFSYPIKAISKKFENVLVMLKFNFSMGALRCYLLKENQAFMQSILR